MAYTPFSERTITSQIAYGAQVNLTGAKLSYLDVLAIKNDTALKLKTMSILPPYMYQLKQQCCATVTFTEEQARPYIYKPKTLAYALYKNVELYSLILRVNHMKSISDFTKERLVQGLILPLSSVNDFLNEVIIKEKKPLARNAQNVKNDVNSLS